MTEHAQVNAAHTPAPAGMNASQLLSLKSYFFSYFGFVGVAQPFLALYLIPRGFTLAQCAVFMSIMQGMRIIGPVFWGWLADAYSHVPHAREWVLRVCAAAGLVAFLFVPWVDTFVPMMVVMIIMHFFVSGQTPLAEGLTVASLNADLKAYGRVRLWGSFGFLFMVLACGPAFDLVGIALYPWLVAVMMAAALVASMVFKTDVRITRAAGPKTPLQLPWQAYVFFASVFCMIAAHSALYSYFSVFLERAGYSKTAIGAFWAWSVVVEIVFFSMQAKLFARWGLRAVLVSCFVVGAARFALTGYAIDIWWLIVLAQSAHALTFAAHHSASIATMQRWFGRERTATAQAIYISVGYGAGGMLATLAMAKVWNWVSPQAVFYSAAGLTVIGGVLAWVCLTPSQAKEA